jgi:NADH:ubiquinone oxidoreductase subunit 6 (subunit J)
MTLAKLVASSAGWATAAVAIGAAIGRVAHANPVFCDRMTYFCELPPRGFGFWTVGIASMLLLHGCVDVLRLLMMALKHPGQPLEVHRWRLAGIQVLIGGVWLLALLLIGFLRAGNLGNS